MWSCLLMVRKLEEVVVVFFNTLLFKISQFVREKVKL